MVLSLLQTISEKTLSVTCAVTAARGRGKSTALGIAVAGAVAAGYSNIFVTAPSPENLSTFFEFVTKGLVELGYKERTDFEIMQSTNPEFSKCTIRVNVLQNHRQTIQYISPQDYTLFSQAELLVIDEAAALPLPLVQKILGPYLVFISSTISGYEGTGRSLSIKLIADMRKHSGDGRSLKELQLSDPIRYGPQRPSRTLAQQAPVLGRDCCKGHPKAVPPSVKMRTVLRQQGRAVLVQPQSGSLPPAPRVAVRCCPLQEPAE